MSYTCGPRQRLAPKISVVVAAVASGVSTITAQVVAGGGSRGGFWDAAQNAGAIVGMRVTGSASIPADTKVATVDSTFSTITLSANTTGTIAAGTTLTLGLRLDATLRLAGFVRNTLGAVGVVVKVHSADQPANTPLIASGRQAVGTFNNAGEFGIDAADAGVSTALNNGFSASLIGLTGGTPEGNELNGPNVGYIYGQTYTASTTPTAHPFLVPFVRIDLVLGATQVAHNVIVDAWPIYDGAHGNTVVAGNMP